jgi:hypothetical protein
MLNKKSAWFKRSTFSLLLLCLTTIPAGFAQDSMYSKKLNKFAGSSIKIDSNQFQNKYNSLAPTGSGVGNNAQGSNVRTTGLSNARPTSTFNSSLTSDQQLKRQPLITPHESLSGNNLSRQVDKESYRGLDPASFNKPLSMENRPVNTMTSKLSALKGQGAAKAAEWAKKNDIKAP